MNEQSLLDANLDDEALPEDSEVAESTSAVEDAAPVTESTETPVTAAMNDGIKAVKAGRGRKLDTSGKTALGKARMIHATNPTLGTKELKELLFKELNPTFGTTMQVAQTYVSLLRKK